MRFRPARAPGGNVCPAEDTGDDGNFAVMQEGAAVLDAGSGMTLEDPFILKNPTREAPGIFVGMPVAGATSDTLRVTGGEAVNGNRYYCVVKDEIGQQVTCEAALLTIGTPSPAPAPQRPLRRRTRCCTPPAFYDIIGKGRMQRKRGWLRVEHG